MMLFLLFLNFVLHASDTTNFFLNCIERKSHFDELPAQPNLDDYTYFNKLNICSMFVRSTIDSLNRETNVTRSEVKFLKFSSYCALLQPNNKELIAQLLAANESYFSKIKPRLLTDWKLTDERNRNYFIVNMHEKFILHQKAYAQYLNNKISHSSEKTLEHFALSSFLFNLFGFLGRGEDLASIENKFAQHCTIQ